MKAAGVMRYAASTSTSTSTSTAALALLALLALLQPSAAQTIPTGCYLLPSNQLSLFNSDSMVPEMCTQKCGSQLALIAPTQESIWNFHCACASTTPASTAPIPCSVKCPGAPIPSQAPPCGGSFNGQISWSAYGNLPAALVAPQEPVVENPPRSVEPSSPPAVVTSAQPPPAVESQQPGSASSSSSSVSVQPSKPSALPSTTSSTSESPISAARNGSVPIAPPSNQGDSGITSEKNVGLNSVGLIAGGFVAGVVVLAVGFTVIAQRRKRPYKQTTAQDQYGDNNRLIQQEHQSGFDSCDTESMSSVSLPPLVAQFNTSYFKDDSSPPVLLYGFGSRSTTLNTVNSPEISFGSPTRTAALGAMPDKLKYSLGTTKDSQQPSSTSSLVGTPATCLVSGPGGGGESIVYPSYYSGGSSYSPLLKLNRGSVGGSSVAASSLFMRGLAKNMKSDEESARGVMRQDVLYTQRRGG
ncbi:hypothetical protein BJ741DRAFT_600118 [Chytriomyces cf. hyalinus JEL632]|nr:hypothetical protein BJ741DRAFT_600118 [Chytriomyces cf. hyalinus JEL632]